ncbi:hypothetical protein [Nonomuraea aridisoli]|uniref:Cobalamin-independent methionine synthase MetE C-terminal/archaeal domain-containing protein n=1 Tax=Nonomuraea aridisoli TaxID=2070368 RepID=A0A2W2E0T9_9ACTN|nr:hypothetical protein [Nonomuraea aridisoli]PZG03157.1 hypothetical protein C1J01_46430 [Nonomuraea aridisoli]
MSIHGVHLVGSVPLADAEEVFRTVAARLADHLRRVPDGETGVRARWTAWQRAVFERTAGFVTDEVERDGYTRGLKFRLREGFDPARLSFGALGYAAAARASWEVFQRLRDDGVLPDLRFQVSLPTPMAPVRLYVDPGSQAAVEPAYEAAMLRELELIAETVPHDRLSIQWDTAVEFGMLEGVFPHWLPDLEQGILDRLTRLGDAVPAGAELGYHLCYGDSGHRHFVQPKDTGRLVAVANALADRLARPLAWIHLPVPIDRTDPAYFAPLRDLRLPAGTDLYLGLLHATDGLDGARRRIDAARTAVGAFGVATECGFGRRPPESIPSLLTLHASAATL